MKSKLLPILLLAVNFVFLQIAFANNVVVSNITLTGQNTASDFIKRTYYEERIWWIMSVNDVKAFLYQDIKTQQQAAKSKVEVFNKVADY